MSKRVHSLVLRAPLSLTFCVLSLVVFVLSAVIPDSVYYLALFPENVAERGYVWAVVTYAALPGSILNLLIVSVPVLWLGWYIEPIYGRGRYIALLVGGALGSGLAYMLAQQGAPLVGGLFVASAVIAAFVIWSVANRTKFDFRLRVFWVFVLLWALYTFWASPLYLAAMHMVSWGVGVLAASWRPRVQAPPNKTMEPTR